MLVPICSSGEFQGIAAANVMRGVVSSPKRILPGGNPFLIAAFQIAVSRYFPFSQPSIRAISLILRPWFSLSI